MEYENPAQRTSVRFHGHFGSRRIGGEPDQHFRVVIVFGPEYETYRSRGTLITIAGTTHEADDDARVHSIWIDNSEIHAEHHFANVTLSVPNASNARSTQHPLTFPPIDPDWQTATTEWMDTGVHIANPGCVSVCIERGELDADLDSPENYALATTLSTGNSQLQGANTTYRLVRSEWFDALRSENGEVYLFEYRCVDPQEVNGGEVADEEITWSQDCNGFVVPNSRISDAASSGHEDSTDEEYLIDIDTGDETASSDGGAYAAVQRSKRQKRASPRPARKCRQVGQGNILVHSDSEDETYPATPAARTPRTTPRRSSNIQKTPSAPKKRTRACYDADDEEVPLVNDPTVASDPPPTFRLDRSTGASASGDNLAISACQTGRDDDIEDLEDRLELIRMEKEEVRIRMQLRAAKRVRSAKPA